jgi:hypothetical protein
VCSTLVLSGTTGRGRGKGTDAAENRGGKCGLQERYAERVLRGLTCSARIQRCTRPGVVLGYGRANCGPRSTTRVSGCFPAIRSSACEGGGAAELVTILTFGDRPELPQVLLVPALYSLFIVIVATFVTFYFRRANMAEEQRIPSLL